MWVNAPLVGQNQSKRPKRFLLTESVNDVIAVFQQLGLDALSRLRKWLGRAYSAISLPCSVAFTRVSGVATTTIRWEGVGSGDD